MKAEESLKKIRIGGLGVLAFFLMFTYSIARPATESLFLASHTSKGLPLVWILVSLSMLGVVTIYSRIVSKRDLLRLYGNVTLATAAILALLIFAVKQKIPGAYYALYVWKDLFVVVQVEIFYSYSNSVFPIKTARWSYSLFGLLSALGGISGNLLVGHLASIYGTFVSLFATFPLFLGVWLFCIFFSKVAGIGKPIEKSAKPGMVEAFRVIRNSNYLTFVLILVALVQIAVTLIDFEFNSVVENFYPNLDIRTGMISKVYAVVSAGTIIFHSLTGPILRLATVPATLIALPLILGGGLVSYIIIPTFLTMATLKTMSKTFTYTLFRSTKEILYIPLSYKEKTLAKSVVDMLTYRVAKGAASLLLLALIALGLTKLTNLMVACLIVLWLIVTVIIVIRFRHKVSHTDEIVSDEVGR